MKGQNIYHTPEAGQRGRKRMNLIKYQFSPVFSFVESVTKKEGLETCKQHLSD